MLSFLPHLIGFGIIVQICHKIYLTLWEVYYKTPLNLSRTFGSRSWVIITGGSDGIGFEFANQLAAQNFNIILISRSADKLLKRALQLRAKYPSVKVETLVADFTKGDSIEYYDSVLDQIKHDNVSMLINCAGQFVGRLQNESVAKVRDAVLVNSIPPFMMTRNFLFKYPSVNENGKKKAVITMSCHNQELESKGLSIMASVGHAVNMFTVSESQNYEALGAYLMNIKPVNV